jgi:hypothetical protein
MAWVEDRSGRVGAAMSENIGPTTYPTAKKVHNCMASEWIVNGDLHETFRCCDWQEKRAIIRARRNKWRIQRGQKYMRQAVIWEGVFCTFKAIPEMHDICVKYDLYQE